jgi:hypothetical protein
MDFWPFNIVNKIDPKKTLDATTAITPTGLCDPSIMTVGVSSFAEAADTNHM